MKMGPKPKNRFKITCLECGVPMNNGHQTKHNLLFHAEMLKQHKVIWWETLNAPKNPFEARPTKVPRTEEAPSTSTNTTSVPDSIATINDRLSCDSANMKQPPPSSAETRGKQSSASEKPATLVRGRVNLEAQNVSWTVEKTKDRSYHPGLITMNGRPGCTTTKRRRLRSVSHASKLSSKI